jgi:hydroxymethylglutaryl-CoA lyase
VYEVGARDGLQNEATVVPTQGKQRLIEALAAAGVARIEATSFVSPKWVPQLADAGRPVAGPADRSTRSEVTALSALVPNAKGLERALEAGSPRDRGLSCRRARRTTRCQREQVGRRDALDVFQVIVPPALDAGLKVRALRLARCGAARTRATSISSASVRIARALWCSSAAIEVSLGDTIGVGTPRPHAGDRARDASSETVALRARGAAPARHPRHRARQLPWSGSSSAIRTLDASVGGLGGCPYAPGASGNLATEDLVYMLERHGVSPPASTSTSSIFAGTPRGARCCTRALPGKVHQAGAFRLRKNVM